MRISDFYLPFPRQREFHSSPARYRLFGGAAGPGKTRALLMEAVLQANAFPKVSTLLMRRTFPELEQSLLKEFRQNVPREMYARFNESKHEVEWHNGSLTQFGYCQREKDVYQYQGAEYVFIGIDELTLFTLRQWQFLSSRNRCGVPGTFPCMAGATNPGNIGHAWVKALWVDRRPAPGMEHPEEYDPREYDFVAARVADNPIYARDEDYLRKLRALPTRLRRAFLDGDWGIFAGQFFDVWEPGRLARFDAEDLRSWWPRWISIDWGYKHPAAVYWHALRDDGVTITYDEFVRSQLDPRPLGRAIVARTAATSHGSRVTDVFLGPDAFAERSSSRTVAEELGDELAAGGLPRPAPADDDRVGGWRLMYQLLRAGQWQIDERCVALARTLPMLVYDELRTEDCAKMDDPLADSGAVIDEETASGDDAADAARYGLKSRHAPGRVPLPVRVAERIEAVQKRREDAGLERAVDPTAVAMMAQKAIADERRTQRAVPLVTRGRRRRNNPRF